MAIDKNDILELQDILDDRYVLQSDCNDTQMKNQKRFAEDDKRIEKQEDFAKGIKKIGWVIVSALLGEVALSLISLLKGI